MKTYLTKTEKSKKILNLLNQALEILESVGIPVEGKTERALERMALCFLDVSVSSNKTLFFLILLR